ncbi:MAG TPA: XRE family transcriptional regulator [Clostridiales bacterium]|nr:XRE family transcriptional regulator [Clostridiales bacterium]
MIISYKKLWKLLIDRDLKKKDLREMAGISPSTIAKLGRNENINTEVIIKICKALKCDICDMMEIIDSKSSDVESIEDEYKSSS